MSQPSKSAAISLSIKMKDDQDEGNEEVPQNFLYVSNQVPTTRQTVSRRTKALDRHRHSFGRASCSPPPSSSLSSSCSSLRDTCCNSNHGNSHHSEITILPGPKSSEEYNWQANQHSIKERNAVMVCNPLIADVHFIIGTEPNMKRIPAHKYILATGSSVFYAMFYGGLAEETSDVNIPDVEPSAFVNLLRYLYCDEILLDADTVLSTLYVAKKYLIPYLARACVNFLETSLTTRNVCVLLSQARLFEEEQLIERCWEVIDAQAEEALRSDGFTEIDYATLERVLLRETLNVQEVSVFNAACAWAMAECARQEIEKTPANKRQVLGKALYLIRLPSTSLEEYANGPAQSGILTLQETTDLFLNFTAQNKPQLKFNKLNRTGLVPQRVHRFQSSAYRSNQWRYRGRCDSIQFCVDRRVFIAGFGLYGSSNSAAEYQVKVELKCNDNILGRNFTKFYSDGSSNTFSVHFENAIQVEADVYYTASVVLDGTELSYFGQEGMAEIQCGKVTFQFQCSTESTNGTGVQGGQIPEIIFYG